MALKQKTKLFDDRLNTLNETLEIRKQAVAKLEEKSAKSEHEIELLKEERLRLIGEQDHYRSLDEENIKLRQTNQLITDELKEKKNELASAEDKIIKLTEENMDLRSNLEYLKNKLKEEKER